MNFQEYRNTEGTRFAQITIDGEQLTRSEIIQKWKSSESFRSTVRELVQRSKEIPEMPVNEPNNQKLVHNRNNRPQKNRLLKSARNTTAARSSLFSIYCKTHRFSTIALIDNTNTLDDSLNVDNFKQIFFNEKHLPQYERLQPLPKLLLCQFVMHKQSGNSLKAYAFTFRLPTHLHNTNTQVLNKKIQRKLTAALNRTVDFWMVRETDGESYDKTLTHFHGEILINPTGLIEYRKVKKAFIELFNAKPKLIQAAESTIIKNPMPDKAKFDFHVSARNSNNANYGELYGVMNWCSYSTKQIAGRVLDYKRRCFDARIQGRPQPPKETAKFHYLSANLNKQAAMFYKANINHG